MPTLELIAFLLSGIGTVIVVFVSPAPSRVMTYQDEGRTAPPSSA